MYQDLTVGKPWRYLQYRIVRHGDEIQLLNLLLLIRRMRPSAGLPLSRGSLTQKFRPLCSMAPERLTDVETSEMVPLDSITQLCARLARRAGGRICAVNHARVAGENLRVTYKVSTDPRSALTEADAAAQAAIVPALRACFPSITIVGEEDDEIENAATAAATDDVTSDGTGVEDEIDSDSLQQEGILGTANANDVAVFVDPLDGTREFVNGNLGAVCTLIGVCVRGRPVSGVISLPFAPDAPVLVAYLGATPDSSYVRGLPSVPLLTARDENDGGVVLAISKGATGVVANVQRAVDPSRVLEIGGAANKILRIATGEADVVILNMITSLWDTAAPEALVIACGGYVTDMFGVRLSHAAGAPLGNRYGVVATSANFSQRDPRHRTHRQLCADIRASMAADELLTHTGLYPRGEPQATDIARDLDGIPLALQFFRENVSQRVTAFTAPENGAVRYLMSDACRIELQADDGESPMPPKSVFLKRVVMQDLPHVQLKARTAPRKLERDVTSYQVEAAFLGSRACARLVATGARIARPLFVECRPAPSGVPPIHSKFLLLLEDFSPRERWAQHGLLNTAQLRACLEALAELHAFFWAFSSDTDVAQLDAAVWSNASYWAPERQAADCFNKLPKCWSTQLKSFAEPLTRFDSADNLAREAREAARSFPLEMLGDRLRTYGEDIAHRVHSIGRERRHPCRTIVHGDAKAANFFLRERTQPENGTENGSSGQEEWEVGMIDFQWCGWGHPALDVGYLIATSAEPSVLSIDGKAERELLRFYYDTLIERLVQFGKAGSGEEAKNKLFRFDDLLEYYELSILDLARLVVSYHWDRIKASPQVLESRKHNIGSNSYNKNVDCALWLIHRTWELLSDLEAAQIPKF